MWGLGYGVCKKACVKGLRSASPRGHCSSQDLSQLIGTGVGEAISDKQFATVRFAEFRTRRTLAQARSELSHLATEIQATAEGDRRRSDIAVFIDPLQRQNSAMEGKAKSLYRKKALYLSWFPCIQRGLGRSIQGKLAVAEYPARLEKLRGQ